MLKKYEKDSRAAAELGKFHDVMRFVTLTCQKTVLWVRGTASNSSFAAFCIKIVTFLWNLSIPIRKINFSPF